jgi:hypothetical protein
MKQRIPVGLGVLGVATLVGIGSACVFDEGKYKGGGRLDTAATAQQSSGSSGATDDDDDSTGTSSSSSGLPADSGADAL